MPRRLDRSCDRIRRLTPPGTNAGIGFLTTSWSHLRDDKKCDAVSGSESAVAKVGLTRKSLFSIKRSNMGSELVPNGHQSPKNFVK